jgi:hypothetical protein
VINSQRLFTRRTAKGKGCAHRAAQCLLRVLGK